MGPRSKQDTREAGNSFCGLLYQAACRAVTGPVSLGPIFLTYYIKASYTNSRPAVTTTGCGTAGGGTPGKSGVEIEGVVARTT